MIVRITQEWIRRRSERPARSAHARLGGSPPGAEAWLLRRPPR